MGIFSGWAATATPPDGSQHCEALIDNNRIYRNYLGGLYIHGPSDSLLTNNMLGQNYNGPGISIGSRTAGCLVNTCHVWGTQSSDGSLNTTDCFGFKVNAGKACLTNCVSEGSMSGNVSIESGADMMVWVGGQVFDKSSWNTVHKGFIFQSSTPSNTYIQAVQVLEHAVASFDFSGGTSRGRRAKINANVWPNVGTTTAGAAQTGAASVILGTPHTDCEFELAVSTFVDSGSAPVLGGTLTGVKWNHRWGRVASATAVGSVSGKMPIYDEQGTLVGYVPVYASIT